MHDNPPAADDEAGIDREIRIASTKDELNRRAGGKMFIGGFGPFDRDRQLPARALF